MNELEIVDRGLEAKRSSAADRINVALLYRKEWLEISHGSQIIRGESKNMASESKWVQLDKIGIMENTGTESGALGSDAINTSTNLEIESSASGITVGDIPTNQENNSNGR